MRTLQRSLLAERHRACLAASGTRSSAVLERLLFRRQPDRRRATTSPCCRRAPGCSRRIPGRSGRTVFAGELSASPRHRPCRPGGNDYAHTAARASRTCPAFRPCRRRAAAVPIATQVHAIPGARVRPIRKRSIRSAAAANDIFFQLGPRAAGAGNAGASAGRHRHAARPARAQVGISTPRARARSSRSCNVPDLGLTPVRAWRRARPRTITALSAFFNTTLLGTLDADGRADDPRRLRSALFERGASPIRHCTACRTSRRLACGATPSACLCTPATLVAPNVRRRRIVFANGVASDHRRARSSSRRLCDVVHRLAPSRWRALGRCPARRRAGQLSRARQPHVVEPQRAAHATSKLRGWAAYDYSHTATCRRGRPTAART